jgi:hypothetical protein
VTHPAFATRSPMVDHVRPGATGGDWASLENLVTACNPCNSIKADFELEQLGWELLPIANDGWDGLVRSIQLSGAWLVNRNRDGTEGGSEILASVLPERSARETKPAPVLCSRSDAYESMPRYERMRSQRSRY